jgi:hypothetical protein
VTGQSQEDIALDSDLRAEALMNQWGTEPVIAPALVILAGMMAWTGEFDECQRWLQRAERALQTDVGPDIGLMLYLAAGMLHAGRPYPRRRQARRRRAGPGRRDGRWLAEHLPMPQATTVRSV